jgi:hypothetical protein
VGVGNDDPGQGKGLDEGLSDRGGMAGCERREPALIPHHLVSCFMGSGFDLTKIRFVRST